MRFLTSCMALMLIILAGCVHEPIHQGNRLSEEKLMQIREGVTKFHVERVLGTPVLKDTLHPNRSVYYEEFEDEESGEMRKRGVEIIYDDALRVIRIERFGFAEKDKQ